MVSGSKKLRRKWSHAVKSVKLSLFFFMLSTVMARKFVFFARQILIQHTILSFNCTCDYRRANINTYTGPGWTLFHNYFGEKDDVICRQEEKKHQYLFNSRRSKEKRLRSSFFLMESLFTEFGLLKYQQAHRKWSTLFYPFPHSLQLRNMQAYPPTCHLCSLPFAVVIVLLIPN